MLLAPEEREIPSRGKGGIGRYQGTVRENKSANKWCHLHNKRSTDNIADSDLEDDD